MIKTKYYSANVTVISCTFSQFNNIIEENQIQQLDAILFLMDANELNDFGLNISKFDEILNQYTPNLQAVIYQRKIGTKINQSLIEAEEQKLEQFIEAIYIDMEEEQYFQKQQQQQLQQTNLLDEEIDGFSRVFEMLECNQWNNMILQQKQTKEAKEVIKIQQQADEDEQFANLLQNITKIRDQTNLSDEQRRVQAENLINQLMQQCNIDDDDD